MELTSDRFNAILDALRGDARDSDKRRAPRVGVAAKVKLCPVDTERPPVPRSARVKDVAKSGIGLLLSEKVRIGRKIAVELPTLEDTTMFILCEVRYCRNVGDGLYAVGATYLKIGCSQPKADKETVPPAARDHSTDEEKIRRAILE